MEDEEDSNLKLPVSPPSERPTCRPVFHPEVLHQFKYVSSGKPIPNPKPAPRKINTAQIPTESIIPQSPQSDQESLTFQHNQLASPVPQIRNPNWTPPTPPMNTIRPSFPQRQQSIPLEAPLHQPVLDMNHGVIPYPYPATLSFHEEQGPVEQLQQEFQTFHMTTSYPVQEAQFEGNDYYHYYAQGASGYADPTSPSPMEHMGNSQFYPSLEERPPLQTQISHGSSSNISPQIYLGEYNPKPASQSKAMYYGNNYDEEGAVYPQKVLNTTEKSPTEPNKKVATSKKTEGIAQSMKEESKQRPQLAHQKRVIAHKDKATDTNTVLPQQGKTKSKPIKPELLKISKPLPKLPIILNVQELSRIGTFTELQHGHWVSTLLKTYFLNGCSLDSQNFQVNVHSIYRLSKKATPYKRAPPSEGSKPLYLLLWSKTTPRAVHFLATEQDGWKSFYDRSARAIALKLDEIQRPLRQILILSSVSLGTVEKSKEGLRYWERKQGNLPGFDSIKAEGCSIPDWEYNRELDPRNIIVPCGNTRRIRPDNYNLEYNEYIVYEASRVRVMYAVDIEIIPK